MIITLIISNELSRRVIKSLKIARELQIYKRQLVGRSVVKNDAFPIWLTHFERFKYVLHKVKDWGGDSKGVPEQHIIQSK